MKLKVVFMGTPNFSVPVLEGLIEHYDVVGVVTQPDKEVGRKKEIRFTPIKDLALQHNIKVFQPIKIKKDYSNILKLDPDIIITCAYGQIIPKEILDYPKYGCINVHASLLPKLRGGAPIHHSIIDGYSKTGITIMYMDEKMDTGDIISQKDVIIEKNFNVEILHDKLSILGRDLLLQTLPTIISGTAKRIEQDDSEATYAYNITREDELINFNKKTIEIYNQIRGLSPFPGAYAMLDGKVIKIYSSRMSDHLYTEKKNGEIVRIYDDGIGVSTADYEIIITDIKIEGKKRMKVKDYLNGIHSDQLLGKIFNEE